MKFGLIADVHLSNVDSMGPIDPYTGFSIRTNDRLEAIDNALLKSISQGCDYFVIMGDLYDKLNPTERLKEALQKVLIKYLDKINIKILIGNHDGAGFTHNYLTDKLLLGLSNDSKLEIVDRLNRVYDANEPRSYYFLPWIENQEDLLEILNSIPKGSDVFGHFEIMGALSSSEIELNLGTPISWFSRFNKVFGGHYHKKQKIKNFTYVGSSNVKDFSEINDEKGFVIYDSIKGTEEFFQLEKRKGYQFRLNENNIDEFETWMEKIEPNSFIKVFIVGQKTWVNDAYQVVKTELRDCKPMRLKIEKEFLKVSVDKDEYVAIQANEVSRHEKIKIISEKLKVNNPARLIKIYEDNLEKYYRGV